MRCPHASSGSQGRNGKPLPSPLLDTIDRALEQQEERGASQYPDQRCQQHEPNIVLEPDAFDNPEHDAPLFDFPIIGGEA